jgi:uncharacterized lipoprotein YmbA
MKNTAKLKFGFYVLSSLAVIFIGCRAASPPVTFYTLTSLPTHVSTSGQISLKDMSIGIGPVRLPKLIDRPQIVTRPAPNKVELAEFHRWGGYLNQNVSKVITNNIAVLTGSNQVLTYPWPADYFPDSWIELDVHQFDGQLGGSVLLNVTWTLKLAGNDELYVKRSVIRQQASGNDYESLVVAKSQILEKFSLLIVRELEMLYK